MQSCHHALFRISSFCTQFAKTFSETGQYDLNVNKEQHLDKKSE
jgi:hypothetical protein